MKLQTKEWYKSKTIWVATIVFVLAVLSTIGVPIPEEVYAVLGSLGLATLRIGNKTVTL